MGGRSSGVIVVVTDISSPLGSGVASYEMRMRGRCMRMISSESTNPRVRHQGVINRGGMKVLERVSGAAQSEGDAVTQRQAAPVGPRLVVRAPA
jgi:hypothetical protein